MKKTGLVLIILLGLAAGFSAPNYAASVNVLDPIVNAGDSLTLYGFIDYEVGQGNPYDVSALRLRYYKVGTNPLSAQVLTGITYLSDYANSGNLLVDGAYFATITVPTLSNGRYTVQLLLNNDIVSQAFFDYDSSISRDSRLSVTDLSEFAGSAYVQYRIDNNNATQNITYNVDFFIPNMGSHGSSVFTSPLFVQNMTNNATAVSFTSSFMQGISAFIARVSSTDQVVQKLPLSFFRLVPSRVLSNLSFSGKLTINPVCDAKAEAVSVCEFSILNNGSYPAVYIIETIGSVESSVSFASVLVNPGNIFSGNLTLNPKEKDAGTSHLTLNLKSSGAILDSKQVTLSVSDRDKINKIDIKTIGLTRNIVQGDSLSVTFRLNNTGDFDEDIRISYSVMDGTEYNLGGIFTLRKGQAITRKIDLTTLIRGLTGTVNFEINAVNDDMNVLSSMISGVNIEPKSYEPVALWNYEVVRMERGNVSSNYLTVQNNGNIDDIYRVIVQSNFAVHTEVVTLSPGEYKELMVPVVSGTMEKGFYSVTGTVCSEISNACNSDNFTVIIYELPVFGNSVVQAVNASANLKAGEAGIFEIIVKNNNADTREYKLVIPEFNGEVKISPESQYVLSGSEQRFWIYLLSNEEKIQDVEYKVLESNVVIKSENLTLSYGSGLLTGFLTIGTASNVAVSVLGLALLSALIVLGIRAFNQSKTELKYWK